jgi:quercetin dioxygenase-like cupin family protein
MGGLATLKLTGRETDGQFSVTELLVPPGYVVPTHVHEREDELFQVLEGELTVTVGDETFVAPSGAFVFGPRGVPHQIAAGADAPARYLVLYTPAGFEGFIEASSVTAAARELPPPPPTPPTEEDLAAVAHLMTSQYGCRFVQ